LAVLRKEPGPKVSTSALTVTVQHRRYRFSVKATSCTAVEPAPDMITADGIVFHKGRFGAIRKISVMILIEGLKIYIPLMKFLGISFLYLPSVFGDTLFSATAMYMARERPLALIVMKC
jgi:hypothetical protein